jgi:tetratricopeptide (TPR) repeat protein
LAAIVPMLGIAAGAVAALIAFARQQMGPPRRGCRGPAAMLALVTTIPSTVSEILLRADGAAPLAALAAGPRPDERSAAVAARDRVVQRADMGAERYATFWVQDRAVTRAAMGQHGWRTETNADSRSCEPRSSNRLRWRAWSRGDATAELGKQPGAEAGALAPNQVDTAPPAVAGEVHAQAQESIRAEAAIREAIRLAPDYLPARRRLAALSMRQGPAAGIGAYREVLRIDPLDAEAHRRLADLYESIGMTEVSILHRVYLKQLMRSKCPARRLFERCLDRAENRRGPESPRAATPAGAGIYCAAMNGKRERR